jgi:hypothetical protein
MTSPRPPLRLVEPPRRADDDSDSAPVEREPHDIHPPYHELRAVDDEAGADAIEDTPRSALSPRFVVAALIVFQALAASTFLGKYVALAHGDDQFRFAAAMSVPASLCLYIGAGLLALRPGRGRVLFIVAACGFGLSLPGWGVGYGWSWPMAFGAIVALAGAWYARPEPRPGETPGAQP